MRSRFALAAVAALVLAAPALADDPPAAPDAAQPAPPPPTPAAFLTKVFTDACLPNLGNPSGVQAWAAAHELTEIKEAAPLAVFVGPGGTGGAAWGISTPIGDFVLATRASTQACAVYARAADPAQVEESFTTLVKGGMRPGLTMSTDTDTHTPSPYGQVHTLAYTITAASAPTSLHFMMIVVEKPGGGFQATMQGTRAGPTP